MNKFKIHHFFYGLILFIDLSVLFILFLFVWYTITQNTKQRLEFIEREEEKISQDLVSVLSGTEEDAITSLQSMNYLVFCNTSNQKKLDKYARRVSASLRESLFRQSDTVGFFLHNTACDAFYSCYRGPDFARLKDPIQALFRNAREEQQTGSWFLASLDGSPYLFYLMGRRYGSVLLMLSPQRNSKYLEARELLRTQEDTIFEFSPEPSGIPDGFISAVLEIAPPNGLFLVYAQKREMIFGMFSKIQWILISVILILLTLIQVAFFVFLRAIYRPLHEISDSLEKIAGGDLSYRLRTAFPLHEIARLSETINYMLDQIDRYRTDSFNLRMDAVQTKLQYLQLQIRPHFYQNCFKNVYSLLEMQEYEKAEQTILALSDYVGHTFRNVKSFVLLREELAAVQSYVNLCNILRNDIELRFSLDTPSFSCSFLPMTVLTFVENSLKHRRTLNMLHVCLSASVFFAEDTGKKMICVTVDDDGGGFSAEALETLRSEDITQPVWRHRQIGISNVRYRLWLIYGTNASVTFENAEDHAIVKITLPYEKNMEEKAFDDDA